MLGGSALFVHGPLISPCYPPCEQLLAAVVAGAGWGGCGHWPLTAIASLSSLSHPCCIPIVPVASPLCPRHPHCAPIVRRVPVIPIVSCHPRCITVVSSCHAPCEQWLAAAGAVAEGSWEATAAATIVSGYIGSRHSFVVVRGRCLVGGVGLVRPWSPR